MRHIKGPAIDPDAFRVEGHCCGIRIPALMDPNSEGVRFDIPPELKAAVLRAAIQQADGPSEPLTEEEPGEPPLDPR